MPSLGTEIHKWNWAIIVALASIVLTLSGGVLSFYYTHMISLDAIVQRQGERLAVLEVEMANNDKRLQRIEDKLDRLLQFQVKPQRDPER